ncbi:hypothetical protein NQ176_g5037 [Zarea fungicola]|uniref:Uncharacterized protein n=1 Tax=Zarea fungicola TaxID=93591 RepID=A0ACC1NAL1_9HYPO|nr:hypothetical protein NQ176_g5037 [Lecanicillium fungicola]
MAFKLSIAIAILNGLSALGQAQKSDDGTLVLCDCGIGDNKIQPSWSTSRQMNWYKSMVWPDSVSKYPPAPEMAVEVPFGNGKYPWNPDGVTETMPNNDVWSVYIEEQTPESFKAGNAVLKNGETLNCWSYHGRPISAAINKTVNHDALCWSAFVCNGNDSPPDRPSDMTPTSTSSSTTAPSTSDFTQVPAPTESAASKVLAVNAAVSPRFINWLSNWDAFINNFVWDQITGNCVGGPFRGNGYIITFECSGVQIDSDTHMTLQLIKALRDVGMNSIWFNQNPTIPGTNISANGTAPTPQPSWVVMPESFILTATDVANKKVLGRLSYSTKYDTFLANPCSTCDTARFNAGFFDPILEAMKGTFPEYNNYHVQAICDPWVVCI